MIDRRTDIRLVRTSLRQSRVVALLGPRQCGKTTLARQFVPADSVNYFDLEDPQSVARLTEPNTALRPLKGLVVVDEIQRRPELFPLLRVLADCKPLPARFLILGSAAPDLLSQSSETLAGRLETVLLEGFRLGDLGPRAQGRLWLRGLPRARTPRGPRRSDRTWRGSRRARWARGGSPLATAPEDRGRTGLFRARVGPSRPRTQVDFSPQDHP